MNAPTVPRRAPPVAVQNGRFFNNKKEGCARKIKAKEKKGLFSDLGGKGKARVFIMQITSPFWGI